MSGTSDSPATLKNLFMPVVNDEQPQQGTGRMPEWQNAMGALDRIAEAVGRDGHSEQERRLRRQRERQELYGKVRRPSRYWTQEPEDMGRLLGEAKAFIDSQSFIGTDQFMSGGRPSVSKEVQFVGRLLANETLRLELEQEFVDARWTRFEEMRDWLLVTRGIPPPAPKTEEEKSQDVFNIIDAYRYNNSLLDMVVKDGQEMLRHRAFARNLRSAWFRLPYRLRQDAIFAPRVRSALPPELRSEIGTLSRVDRICNELEKVTWDRTVELVRLEDQRLDGGLNRRAFRSAFPYQQGGIGQRSTKTSFSSMSGTTAVGGNRFNHDDFLNSRSPRMQLNLEVERDSPMNHYSIPISVNSNSYKPYYSNQRDWIGSLYSKLPTSISDLLPSFSPTMSNPGRAAWGTACSGCGRLFWEEGHLPQHICHLRLDGMQTSDDLERERETKKLHGTRGLNVNLAADGRVFIEGRGTVFPQNRVLVDDEGRSFLANLFS